jgi:3'-phosphoadenosine 5'-phosphosulfate sulfotransferase (PAPS reductase)/FAD synthetase
MKNYLSFGGGVNSVAMYLYLKDQAVDFEAVFVDHGTDWPETYEYVDMFIGKGNPITILKPNQKGSKPKKCHHINFNNLYDYSWALEMTPSRVQRWYRFKSLILNNYHQKPCFVFIGYDYGERHRAKISSLNGNEYRWPLIEAEIDREGCKQIIKDHGFPIPMKSGCYICPLQRVGQLRELRRKHPDLFCKLEQLEDRNNASRERQGLPVYYSFKKPVRVVAEKGIDQGKLWEEDEYPPCECML